MTTFPKKSTGHEGPNTRKRDAHICLFSSWASLGSFGKSNSRLDFNPGLRPRQIHNDLLLCKRHSVTDATDDKWLVIKGIGTFLYPDFCVCLCASPTGAREVVMMTENMREAVNPYPEFMDWLYSVHTHQLVNYQCVIL